jgi:diguanylate cyclase (GGDEF)-like protein
MRSRTLEILLVENHEADALTVFRFAEELNLRMLEREGRRLVNLTRVTRLAEALRHLERHSCDVVLLDLTLPDSFALHTYRAVAALAPRTPVVVLTGADDDSLAGRSIIEGAQDYLVKGQFTAASLGRVIRFAVERQRLYVALRSALFVDPLTDLYTTRGFISIAEILLDVARRTGSGVVMTLLELDNLNQLQQAGGMEELDRAALELTQTLRDAFRPEDLLGRLGAGSFASLVVDTAGEGVLACRTRLRTRLPTADPNRLPAPLQLSVGAAGAGPQANLTPEDLILHTRLNLAQNEFHPARVAAGGL